MDVLVQGVVCHVSFLGEGEVAVIVGGKDSIEDTKDDLENAKTDSKVVLTHFFDLFLEYNNKKKKISFFDLRKR